MIEVREVAGRSGRREFVEVPYRKYRGDPYWRPPLRIGELERLNPAKSPFLEHSEMALFVATSGGSVVGRIAAINDRNHAATHHDGVGAFGFFEADTSEAAGSLLASAEGWVRSRGLTAIRGPLNPSLNESAGLLIDGFDDAPFLLMPYNPPAYAEYLEGAGYRKVKDLYAWIYDLGTAADARIGELAERVKKRHGIVVRQIDTARMEQEIRSFLDIYVQAWKHNWGFVAPSEKESAHFASELKQILEPAFVLSAEVQGTRAACIVAVPDLNQVLNGTDGRLLRALLRLPFKKRLIDQGRLLLLGVLPEYQGLGLLPVLIHEMAERAKGRGIRRVEFSWVLEDNVNINQPAEQGGARRYKTYRIYQKALA